VDGSAQDPPAKLQKFRDVNVDIDLLGVPAAFLQGDIVLCKEKMDLANPEIVVLHLQKTFIGVFADYLAGV